MESVLPRKISDIQKWKYVVQLFDDRGRRVFTDYFTSADVPDRIFEFAKQHATMEGRLRKPACGVIIRREGVASKEWRV